MNRLIALFLIFAIIGCVPNKKIVLLQNDDLYNSSELNESLRQYTTPVFEYRIQPEDVLSVNIESLTPKEFDFFNSESKGSFGQLAGSNAPLFGKLVDNSGEIDFPFVGKVKVQGLTVLEAQEKIQTVADEYLDTPVVRLRLLNFRFTVLGEVPQQGTFSSFNNRTSLLEAIGLAGGLGELSDRSRVKIVRQIGNDKEVIYVDLLDENFLNSPFYYVHQNDLIIVSPLKQRPFRTYFGQNLSLVLSSISTLLLIITITR